MGGALKSNKLEIHLKSFRSTSLIGTIGVMASISAFQAEGTGSSPVFYSIKLKEEWRNGIAAPC